MERYQGRLYYDGGDEYLQAIDFLVREDGIAFTLDSTTAQFGSWRTTGVARREGAGYTTRQVSAQQRGVSSANDWCFTFQLEQADPDLLEVQGSLRTGEGEFPFAGDLERVAPVARR